MIYLNRFCCVCLNARQKLEKLTIQKNNLSYYEKLSILIPQLDIDGIKEAVYVCGECKICIDNMYTFRKACLLNNTKLWKFISNFPSDKSTCSVVSNKSNETEVRKRVGYVDRTKFDVKDIKIEFAPVDDYMVNNNEIRMEKQSMNDILNVDIKQEIPDDDLLGNNSRMGDAEIYKDIEIKKEDITSLHTELNIDCVKTETTNNESYLRDNFHEENTTGNKCSSNKPDVDPLAENTETNMNKPLENNLGLNHPRTDHSLSSGANGFKNSRIRMSYEDNYKCEICNKTFIYNSDFQRHVKIHTGERPYKCELCDKSFILNSDLKVHIRIHTGEKPYKCDVCNKSFTNSSHLKRHSEIHTDEKLYKCEICNKCFRTKCNLNGHVKLHTGEKPYRCKDCSECFTNSSELKSHVRIHTDKKCEICNKTFICNSILKKHIKIHTSKKPYNCDTCNKTFINSNDLKVHLRVHTGEKPYKCEICNKSFTVSSNLAKHVKTHTAEKPYKCETCNKTFAYNSELNKHIRTHTGEKPYKCEICSKSFGRNSDLKIHTRIHTGEIPYKFEICKKIFSDIPQSNIQSNINFDG